MHDIISGMSDHSRVLRIHCDAPTTTEKTTENTMPSDQPQSSPQTTESVKSTTKSSIIYTTSTAPTTNNSTIVKHQLITTATKPTTGNIVITEELYHDNTNLKVNIHEIFYNNI